MIIGLVGSDGAREKARNELRQLFSHAIRLKFNNDLKEYDEVSVELRHFHDGARKNLGIIWIDSPDEADLVRKKGGVIWHVLGYPSDTVPIESHDLIAVVKKSKTRPGGRRRSVQEALSETIRRAW